MKKIICIGCILLNLCAFGFARDMDVVKSKFDQVISCFKTRNYERSKKLIEDWEKEDPECPEIAVLWFNYYSLVRMEVQSTKEGTDDGGSGMYPKQRYNEEDVKKAFEYLQKAIEKNPLRLDMIVGRCSLASVAQMDKELCEYISYFIDQAKEPKPWKWSFDEDVAAEEFANPEQMIVAFVNDYITPMFDRIVVCENELESIIKKEYSVFPNNTWVLNHYARLEMMRKNYDQAIKYLSSACKIDPSDYICKGNLGYCYEKKGDVKKAKKIYTELSKDKREQVSAYGKQSLEELNNKK